uniref:Uncharacterized protein n=1 Tax=Plectus sambesii TaxID=2011161 RepID=A0A914W650_9BILA
ILPVKAFRIEPIDQGSFITVDGEAIKCNRIQATNTTYKVRIIGE